jgi:enoyl-CoA hydratase/carnithine racemase
MGTSAAAVETTVEIDGGVAVLTLAQPERLNRWTKRMADEIGDALVRLDADPAVRVVVLTGAGRAFCAGLDLGAAPSFEADSRPEPLMLPWQVGKPVIAAINGHAIGVGITFALTADVRFVARTAKIQFPFVRLGLVSELGSHAILARVVGLSHAADLLLSGRLIDGDEAVRLGLASRALPPDDVLPAALAWAREVAAHALPGAARVSKRLLWDSIREQLTVVAPAEVEAMTALSRSAETREALARLAGSR